MKRGEERKRERKRNNMYNMYVASFCCRGAARSRLRMPNDEDLATLDRHTPIRDDRIDVFFWLVRCINIASSTFT